jgi:hypothetical protein
MNCGSCDYSFIDQAMGGLMVCRRYPPKMTAFMKIYTPTVGTGTALPSPGQEEQMQSFFNFPVVNPSWGCGEYKARG